MILMRVPLLSTTQVPHTLLLSHRSELKVMYLYINRVVQERRNSIDNALELRLSCTTPSMCYPLVPDPEKILDL